MQIHNYVYYMSICKVHRKQNGKDQPKFSTYSYKLQKY